MAIKYKMIAGELRKEIQANRYPADSLLPTEQALCRRFDASRQTIRQALQCLVDEGYIERRQGSGSRVLRCENETQNAQKNIAIVTTYISNYIFPTILREAESVLSANNCNIMLYATSNRVSEERRILEKLLADPSPDGIILEGTKTALPNTNLDLFRKLQQKNIPLVFINGYYKELEGITAIMDDNFGGGYQLVQYLISKGHTQIAGLFKSDDIQGHQRYAGFATALRENGFPVEDKNLYWYSTETKAVMNNLGNFWEERIAPVIRDCTAVVCYNDEIASYLLQYLKRRGIRVPEQLAVVSFDNSYYSELSSCRITSLSHGDLNAGTLAANALLDLLHHRQAASITMPWVLEEKESS